MADSGEILRQHLNEVPEPLRAVIKEYLADDILTTGLGDLSAKYGLDDEQRESVLTECLMVLCHVTPEDELKDSLIAEANVNYETAVRIQRAFETGVLLPIATEAESRGYDPTEASEPAQPPAVPLDTSRQESVLYDNPSANVRDVMALGVQVYPGLLRVGGEAIPMRAVSGVKAWQERPDISGFAINLAFAVIGVIVILTFSWWSLAGLVMLLIGGFNVKGAFTKKFNVTIDFVDRESMLAMFKDSHSARELRDALEQAMRG